MATVTSMSKQQLVNLWIFLGLFIGTYNIALADQITCGISLNEVARGEYANSLSYQNYVSDSEFRTLLCLLGDNYFVSWKSCYHYQGMTNCTVSGRTTVGEIAARTIVNGMGERAVPDLISILDRVWKEEKSCEKYHSRGCASIGNTLDALMGIKDPRAVPAIVQLMRRDPYWCNYSNSPALNALKAFGKLSVQPLVELVEDSLNNKCVALAADVLGKIGDFSHIDALRMEKIFIKLEKHPDPKVKRLAKIELAKRQPASAAATAAAVWKLIKNWESDINSGAHYSHTKYVSELQEATGQSFKSYADWKSWAEKSYPIPAGAHDPLKNFDAHRGGDGVQRNTGTSHQRFQ